MKHCGCKSRRRLRSAILPFHMHSECFEHPDACVILSLPLGNIVIGGLTRDLGYRWLAYHNGLLRNVDELQAEFRTNRTSRQAFTDIFEHIFTCISTDIVPSRNSISALDTDIRTGWLQEALQTLLQYAAEQDKKVGNGIFDEAAGDNLKFLSEHEWVCRNDHEFGFVSRVLEGFF